MINVGTVTQSVSTTVGKKPKSNALEGSRPLSSIPDDIPAGLTPEERAEVFYQMDKNRRPDLSSLPEEDIDAIKLKAYELDALETERIESGRMQNQANLNKAKARGRAKGKSKPAPQKTATMIPTPELDPYAGMMEVFDEQGNSIFVQSTDNVDPGPGLIFDDMSAEIVVDDLTKKSAQAGKQTANNVVKNVPRSTASLSNSATNTVAQSIMRNKNLKMNALMLGLGGAGAGYGYTRSKKR